MIIFVTFNLLSANAFNLVWSKTLSCGNELTLFSTLLEFYVVSRAPIITILDFTYQYCADSLDSI